MAQSVSSVADQSMWPAPGSSRLLSLTCTCRIHGAAATSACSGSASSMFMWYVSAAIPKFGEPIFAHSHVASARVLIMWFSYRFSGSNAMTTPSASACAARSEEHTSELQSHSDLHCFPTRRSSDLCTQPRGIGQSVDHVVLVPIQRFQRDDHTLSLGVRGELTEGVQQDLGVLLLGTW